ncbi:297_t:CDS:2 [Scutellospora calospora]|uniref:297_t:CDS:1 n=1 Tax=Scutellospora calospora TaxID=85575 RepID=A0ACA9JVW1_9GLOM|nr:297_t:CDS:2 [Scutellospora calospora]
MPIENISQESGKTSPNSHELRATTNFSNAVYLEEVLEPNETALIRISEENKPKQVLGNTILAKDITPKIQSDNEDLAERTDEVMLGVEQSKRLSGRVLDAST